MTVATPFVTVTDRTLREAMRWHPAGLTETQLCQLLARVLGARIDHQSVRRQLARLLVDEQVELAGAGQRRAPVWRLREGR